MRNSVADNCDLRNIKLYGSIDIDYKNKLGWFLSLLLLPPFFHTIRLAVLNSSAPDVNARLYPAPDVFIQ